MLKADTKNKVVHTTKQLSKADKEKLTVYISAGYTWKQDIKRKSANKALTLTKADLLNLCEDEIERSNLQDDIKELGFFVARKNFLEKINK